jgi:hypothetical protein
MWPKNLSQVKEDRQAPAQHSSTERELRNIFLLFITYISPLMAFDFNIQK